jgi:hypothetical protein
LRVSSFCGFVGYFGPNTNVALDGNTAEELGPSAESGPSTEQADCALIETAGAAFRPNMYLTRQSPVHCDRRNKWLSILSGWSCNT